MLVGRERECERVERLLDDARRGRSGALLLCGEAGIGKTALLEWAIEHASGMQVARATGIESEAELEFSGLLEVCRPLLGHLSELPARQADALRGALGLGPAEAHDRFSIGAATLSLLAAAGDETPLLVVADDVQWLDQASADAILFAARRLAADRVAVLLAAREPDEHGVEIQGIERVVLAGLESEAATRLLSREHRPDEGVVERLRSATGGNPLALLELSRLLTPEQLAGAEPLPDPVPAGPVIERAFAGRVRELPDDARTAFLVAALGTPCDVATAERALGALGAGASALEALEDAGLVGVTDGMIVFPHPLLRSAAVAASRASERRAVHRALAEALPPRSERRAWHLGASARGKDESAARALEDAAEQALERSGYAAAASALERAARLSESDVDRARRTYRAAEAGWLAGQTERALGLLDEALRPGIEPVLRAHVLHLRGRIELLCGNAHTAYATLAEAADVAEEADPAVAVDILADAAEACEFAALPEHALRAAERARALCPRDGGPPDFLADLRLGIASMLNGRPREGEECLSAALATFESSELLPSSPSHVAAAALAAAWLDRQAEALDLATRATALARESGALGLLPYSLELAAWVQARCGRWQQAYAAASEALPLTRERGQTAMTALELIHLTWIDTGRGDEEAARAHAAEVRAIATVNGLDLLAWWVDCAIGLLALGLGNLEEALELLESVERNLASRAYYDRDLSPGANLVEIYARLGRTDDAARALDRYIDYGTRTSTAWSPAVVERCRGILASDEEFEQRFLAALASHAPDDPFGLARTRLLFGERLRRAGRRREARRELRAALGIFEQLGARPWAERARSELQASGERLRRRDPAEAEQLTPQELQIALQVAGGKSNKEVGAALFLSHKTVEAHLGRIYRKLGVSSRAELIHRFATDVGPAGS